MEKKKVIVTVNGVELHLILGRTYATWENVYGGNEDLWDFPLEEILDGTVEPNGNIWYWYIGGRLYETDVTVE
jgi:hypothetical protein